MSEVKFKGNPVHIIGNLPGLEDPAPQFTLTKGDLTDITSSEFAEKILILNIFPSLDTDVCASSVRRFNKEAARLNDDCRILNISQDLPFAQQRFCGNEGITNSITLSAFRNPDFGKDYGLTMIDGPLKGLLARAVLVIDRAGIVTYGQLVPEITTEPNYHAALAAVEEAQK